MQPEVFVPSLDRLRAEAAPTPAADAGAGDEPPPPSAALDLLARNPVEAGRYAAVVVAADILRREQWVEDVDMSQQLYERYPRRPPPNPPEAFRDAGYQFVDGEAGAPRRCGDCFLQPGRAFCSRCGGTGYLPGAACSCNNGYMACMRCDGTGQTVRARVVHLNDSHVRARSLYAPRALAPYQAGLEQLVKLDEPPSALRVPLEARMTESAYRGATAAVAAEFHGHAYGEALDAALAATAELRRQDVVKEDVRAYAWPVLLVRVEVERGPLTVALVIAPGGRSRVLLA